MFKVSVIISCYKNEEDIQRAVESCALQTLDEIEVIVVNDGSPDGSQAIVDQMVEKYPGRVFSYVKENGGIASVRNFGIEKVRGKYFGFLDGDDYVEPDMFEKMYEKAEAEQSEMCLSGFWFTHRDHEDPFMEGPYHSSSDMMKDLYAVVWNKIYRTDFIRALDVSFPLGCRFEDVSFLYKIAPHLHRISSVDEPFIHYVQREGSITASHNDKVKQVVEIWNDLIQYYKDQGFYETYQDELEYSLIRFMLGQPFRSACKIQDANDRQMTLDLLWKTLNTHFSSWKKNEILRSRKDAKHLYFRCVNRFTYPVFSFLFSML